MSKWEQTYKNNPVHNTIKKLIEILNDDEFESDNLVTTTIDQVKEIIYYTQNSLENVLQSLVLVNKNSLEETDYYLNAILCELSIYKENKDFRQIHKISKNVDALFYQLSSFSPMPQPA